MFLEAEPRPSRNCIARRLPIFSEQYYPSLSTISHISLLFYTRIRPILFYRVHAVVSFIFLTSKEMTISLRNVFYPNCNQSKLFFSQSARYSFQLRYLYMYTFLLIPQKKLSRETFYIKLCKL